MTSISNPQRLASAVARAQTVLDILVIITELKVIMTDMS